MKLYHPIPEGEDPANPADASYSYVNDAGVELRLCGVPFYAGEAWEREGGLAGTLPAGYRLGTLDVPEEVVIPYLVESRASYRVTLVGDRLVHVPDPGRSMTFCIPAAFVRAVLARPGVPVDAPPPGLAEPGPIGGEG